MFVVLQKIAISLSLLLSSAASVAAEKLSAADFTNYQGKASFSTQSSPGSAQIWYGDALAKQATTPASTFKVFVALVALQTGALTSAEEVIAWNGVRYPHMPEWEKSMNLREAMQSSSESYFGVLSKRIGREAMAHWVKQLKYGNQRIGIEPQRAWLDDVFLITGLEQLAFMERLRQGTLGIDARHIAAVKTAMLSSEERGTGGVARIYGKTGTSGARDGRLGVGWWVGFVEYEDDSKQGLSFALRIEMSKPEDRQVRVALGSTLLRKLGLLPQ